jgi:nucleolar protein 56
MQGFIARMMTAKTGDKASLKGRLFLTEAGAIILDKPMEMIVAKRFPEGEAPQMYRRIEAGEADQWLKNLLTEATKKGVEIFLIHGERLRVSVSEAGYQTATLSDHEIERIQSRKTKLMIESGWAKDEKDAQNIIRDFALEMANLKLREMAAKPDLQVIQSVQALDETDKMLNIFEARIREWYGLHFPELEPILDNPDSYAKFIAKFGRRSNITRDGLEKIEFSKEKIEDVLSASERSRGSDLRDEDLKRILELAEEVSHLSRIRETLSKHVEQTMVQLAPNVTGVAGATIGARLLARTGGLEKMAQKPASTIQVLGAEKALFRALRTGGRPPKHGILFQHQAVHSAPKWQRGKIARSLAAKIAIAARIDFYRGSEEKGLKENLQKRFEEIREKYGEPPAPNPRYAQTEKRGWRRNDEKRQRWKGKAQKDQGRRQR